MMVDEKKQHTDDSLIPCLIIQLLNIIFELKKKKIKHYRYGPTFLSNVSKCIKRLQVRKKYVICKVCVWHAALEIQHTCIVSQSLKACIFITTDSQTEKNPGKLINIVITIKIKIRCTCIYDNISE